MSDRGIHSFTKHANSGILHLNVPFCCLFCQVIMWMLRVGKGKVDTVFKVIKFFPSKLPQYQDQCVSVQHWTYLLHYSHAF